MSCRPPTEAPRLFAQPPELLRSGVRPCGGRRPMREGDDGIPVEQPQHGVCRMANVPLVARIQVRARGVTLRGSRLERDDQRVCGVSTEKPLWAVHTPVLPAGLRRTETRTRSRLRLTGSKSHAIFDGVEHPFSRPRRCRSGILRSNVLRIADRFWCRDESKIRRPLVSAALQEAGKIAGRVSNACGDCAPCGYVCIYRGNKASASGLDPEAVHKARS